MQNFIRFLLCHFILNFIVLKCEDELVMLIELFRHGARNPSLVQNFSSVYPDPFLSHGDLTPVGYR